MWFYAVKGMKGNTLWFYMTRQIGAILGNVKQRSSQVCKFVYEKHQILLSEYLVRTEAEEYKLKFLENMLF